MELSRTRDVVVPQSEIMREAKNDLSGNWGLAVVTFLVFIIISGILSLIPFVTFFISGPFTLGLIIWAQKLNRNQYPQVGNIFDGFQNFGTAFIAYLLMALAVIVGLLCFIIPGIIVALGLSMTMYIIEDKPHISASDALQESWELMKGQKLNYFVLGLRFLPRVLLSIITLFIGLLWIVPWMQVTMAKFYNYLAYGNSRGIEEDGNDMTKHLIDA